MKRSSVVLLALVAASSAATVLGAARLDEGGRRLGAARQRFAHAQRDSREITELRGGEAVVAYGERPDADLYRHLRRALAEADVAASHLSGVTPEGDKPLAGAAAGTADTAPRIQTVRVSLESLTVEQLGRLLSSWRTDQPRWSIDRLEMSQSSDARRPDVFDIQLVMTSIYVPDGRTPPTEHP